MNRMRITGKHSVGKIGSENQMFLQTTDSKRGNERAKKSFAPLVNIEKRGKKTVQGRHHTDTFRHTNKDKSMLESFAVIKEEANNKLQRQVSGIIRAIRGKISVYIWQLITEI